MALHYILLLKFLFLNAVLARNQNVLEANKRETVNNSTLLEVHVRLFNDLLAKDAAVKDKIIDGPIAVKTHDCIDELEDVLTTAVQDYDWWSATYLIREVVNNTQNATVHYIGYKVLWRKLITDKLQYDPAYVIDFYLTLKNVTHDLGTHTGPLITLEHEVRAQLVERSAQLLEVTLHPANYENISAICLNTSNYEVARRILTQLDATKMGENIFEEILNVTFDAVERLESKTDTVKALNCLGLNANQRLIAHLVFLQRNNDLHALLYNNIQQLVSTCDLNSLAPKYWERIGAFLPTSMEVLHNSSAVCIHNVTGGFGYLSECSQTSLMCTFPNGYKYRSAFRFERLLGNRYIFQSIYWQNYIKLENSGINGNSTVPPAFIKNIYGSATPSVWQAVFVGNNVALVDPSMRQYLCGGNQSMWSNAEQYVYSRRAEDFQLYQHECLWLVEDCSDMI
ncbi:uncharacterized protein LOC126761205 [Bactrocera neohumeralis]|uniref:uncharacterized protein LOC126761205 n=1 Tax=Bactrocera neohumeralis TaxID=98809 RepID=UPI002166628D|nr:uncharacterized protein LOC126761205 [Bactrocera neohumeralis]